MKKCKKCGALQSDDRSVCLDCGSVLGRPMTEEEEENIKVEYVYSTSDTKYILPSEFCALHSLTETPLIDPNQPGTSPDPEQPMGPLLPAVPTPTPVPDTTDPFSNGGFQQH